MVVENNRSAGIISLPGRFFNGITKGTIGAALDAIGNDNVLDIAQNVLKKATQAAILKFISVVSKIVFSAMIGFLGPVDSIWKSLMKNPANKELLAYLQNNWWVPAYFLLDVLEPMKRFVKADSPNGTPIPGAEEWNNYNELDMDQPMNRHAVFSQVQRFIKSILQIFMQTGKKDTEFEMKTSLDSDTHLTAWNMTALKRKDDPVKEPETWLFVNGIAGEFYWDRLAVHKLHDFFFDPDTPESKTNDIESRRTEIRAIFNRSDGILWDLVECGGERSLDTQATPGSPTSRTESSLTAQRQLSVELRTALTDSKTSKKDIVMIAHSQGCLILRLALADVWNDTSAGLQKAMTEHLKVYTFGNPALDWEEHAFAKSTEHFANELDFVAKLGVLLRFKSDDRGVAPGSDLTYCSKCRNGDQAHLRLPKQLIFVNNKAQRGHLFGSQYSLRAEDYDCVSDAGSPSALLQRSNRRVTKAKL